MPTLPARCLNKKDALYRNADLHNNRHICTDKETPDGDVLSGAVSFGVRRLAW